MIAGVASGIARGLGTSPTLIRVLFVIVALWGGAGIIAYLIGWALMPEEGSRESIAGNWARKVEQAAAPEETGPEEDSQ